MSDNKYTPISCNYHSIIEHYASLREYCRIQFKTPLKEFRTVEAMIIDVYTENSEEFIKLSTGDIIRLDYLVRINKEAAPGYDESYFGCDC